MNDMLTIAGDGGLSGIEVGVVSGFILERIREIGNWVILAEGGDRRE